VKGKRGGAKEYSEQKNGCLGEERNGGRETNTRQMPSLLDPLTLLSVVMSQYKPLQKNYKFSILTYLLEELSPS
jgi:hypothetical protein